jgi:hypothetical protein
MSTSVFCLAASDMQANNIVQSLKLANFRMDDISVLYPDKNTSRDFAIAKGTKAPEGAAAGGATGVVVGGALGWMVGIGLLAIPGVGPFIAAGPIMAMLSGAAVGATVGGLTGTLIGMGIPEFEAKRYEGKIKEGRILISVHADNSEWANRAKKIFKDANAEDITSTSEASADTKSTVGNKSAQQKSTVMMQGNQKGMM